jgi:PAS domain S-box-containing protein
MRPSPHRTALRLALLYVAISGAWILFSDRGLESLTTDLHLLTHLQTLKGWAFVVCTGALLYVFVRRAVLQVAHSDVQVQLAEHALRQTETSLRLQSAALEAADNAVAIADRDGRIAWVNSAFTRLTGYTAQEALGRTLRATLPVNQDPAVDPDAWETVLDGRSWHGEVLTYRKDGSAYTEEQTITPVRNEIGTLSHLIAIKQDVTARKRAEAALAEERNLLRTLIDNLPDYIFIKDTQSRFVIINRAQADLLGVRSPEEAVGKTDLDFLPSDVALQYRADEERVVQAGEPFFHQEERGPRRTAGEADWHLTTKVPLRDATGKVVGLVGISRNITGVKRAEEALLRRTRQLEAIRSVSAEITRELQLTALLDLITRRAAELVDARSGTLYLWDEEQQVLTAKAWIGPWVPKGSRVRLLGEGVAGTVAARRQGMMINDYRSSPFATAETLNRPGVTAVIGEPLLYRERLAGVIAFDNQGVSRPFTREDGEVLNLFAAQAAIAVENARLFSELNRSYVHLRRAQDELIRSEKLRALGQMSAGVAHDLNNTLASILGQVELLQRKITDPDLRESLGILEVAATDGAEVVRRLQGFARQQPAGELTPCDLAHVVAEALEISRPRWRDEVQRLGYLIEVKTALENLPPVLGRSSELRVVLANLILNAVDAMPHGGTLAIAGRQTLAHPEQAAATDTGAPAAAAPVVELRITDTGVGMTEEIRQRVFEPFFTTKGSQGTGLGLSMVYGIVERHGGRIEVVSAPGQGTTFTLRLQSAPAEPPAGPLPRPRGGPPRRLLVIDDDARVRQTVAGLLRSAGHHTVEADGGREGLTRFVPEEFDLVLTDLGMPEVNGWDVAAAVKARHPACPVILLTGWGDEHTGDGSGRGLADRVLNKPVRLKELLQTIAELTPDT